MNLEGQEDNIISNDIAPKSSRQVENKEAESDTQKDLVSYETHKKLLAQRKKDQERLREYEQTLADIERERRSNEEKKLHDQGEYKKLVALREQEIEKLNSRLGELQGELQMSEKSKQDTWKLNAFYEKLPGRIKKKEYLQFVNLDQIAYDPETGHIDDSSVDLAVNSFMDEHQDLVQPMKAPVLPSGYPRGSGKLTYEQWKSLPLAEMKKRAKDVIKN